MIDIDKIKLNVQNSIMINTSIGNIYIDPLKFETEPHDASFILITHEHYDHFSPDDILKVCNEDTILVVPEKMVEDTGDLVSSVGLITTVMPDIHKEISGLIIDTIPAYNKLKPFHSKRAGWVGYILTVDDTRIYIAGDTDITNENEVVTCDIAIVPIGGKYTMNAIQAAQLVNVIKPKIAIPCHYGELVGTPEDADVFKNHVDSMIEVKIKLLL